MKIPLRTGTRSRASTRDRNATEDESRGSSLNQDEVLVVSVIAPKDNSIIKNQTIKIKESVSIRNSHLLIVGRRCRICFCCFIVLDILLWCPRPKALAISSKKIRHGSDTECRLSQVAGSTKFRTLQFPIITTGESYVCIFSNSLLQISFRGPPSSSLISINFQFCFNFSFYLH